MALPLTYPDLVCELDLDPFGAETTTDLQSLMQDVLHLLIEYPNSNPDDPDRGIGIMQYLSADEPTFRGLGPLIDKQLGADDRINSSKTTIVAESNGSFTVTITLEVSGEVIPLQYGVSGAGVKTL